MLNEVKEKLRGTKIYGFVGNYLYVYRARQFDKKYNVETAREVRLNDLKIDSPNLKHGVFYAGTDSKSFPIVFEHLKIDFPEFVFVNLGSGKGRVLLMASLFPFKKIVGIEFAPELNAVARNNISTYKNPLQQCRNIESHCHDAALFELPPEPCIVDVFNAFHAEIVARVAANIEQSHRKNPRPIYFVYANAVHDEVLRENKFFKPLHTDNWYSIYQCRPE